MNAPSHDDAGDVLITQARLIDPHAKMDQQGWLLAREGVIAALGDGEPPAFDGPRLDAGGRVLAPGFIDVGARLDVSGAVGESWRNLSRAALRGGVTTLLIGPHGAPAADTPEAVTALREAAAPAGPRLNVMGALTRGERLAEMGLMREAGAVAAASPVIADARLMRAGLHTAQSLNLPVASAARHHQLEAGGIAHDGPMAARLGLAGLPPAGEAVAIARDAALAREADATLIVTGLSSREGLAAIADAKARSAATERGRILAAIPAYSLMFNDVELAAFNPAFRLIPPVREEADRQALIDAVADGLVDIIASEHDAVALQDKQHAFDDAAPGAPGLETLAASALSLTLDGRMPLTAALAPLTSGPAAAFGLGQGRLTAGAPADLVLLDIDAPWACRAAEFASQGRVTPYEGRLMTGRVIVTLINGRVRNDARG